MRRVLRGLAWCFAGGALVVLIALVVARLYWNDARIKEQVAALASARLGVEVEITDFDLAFTSGVELHGLRVGPPTGFVHDVARIERMALHWRLAPLFALTLHLPEIAIDGLTVTLEETSAGRNVDALLAALRPREDAPPNADPAAARAPTSAPTPPSAVAPSPTAPRAKTLPELPSLPLEVKLDRLAVTEIEARIIRPTDEVRLTRAGFELKLWGEGRELDASLWLGLGGRTPGGRSELVVRRAEPALEVAMDQRLDIDVHSRGLAETTLSVRWDAGLATTAPLQVPRTKLSAEVDAKAELVAQKIAVPTLRMSLGEKTRFDAALTVSELLSTPRLLLERLTFTSDLAELAPLIAAVKPDTSLAGTLSASVAPGEWTADAANTPATVGAALSFAAQHLAVRSQGNAVDGLELEGRVTVEGGRIDTAGTVEIERARSAAGQEARDVALRWSVATPLLAWLPGQAREGFVTTKLGVDVGAAEAAHQTARGLAVTLDVDAPVALLQRLPSDAPLEAALRLRLAEAATPVVKVRGIGFDTRARAWDLEGKRVEARADANIDETKTLDPDRGMSLPRIELGGTVRRRGSSIDLSDARFALGALVTTRAKAGIDGFDTRSPRVRGLEVDVEPLALDRLLALLPAAARPPLELSGTASASFALQGTLPLEELARTFTPPKPQLVHGQPTWASTIDGVAEYLERVAKRFETGLPFTSQARFSLTDVAMSNETSALADLDLTATLDLGAHAPKAALTMTIAEVQRPSEIGGVLIAGELGLVGRELGAKLTMSAARLVQPALTEPIAGLGFDWAFRYRLGGDLLLDRFVIAAESLDARFGMNGLLAKPLQLARERGWERAGLPGLEAKLRTELRYASKSLVSVTPAGPAVKGTVRVDGELTIAEGLARLGGALKLDDLSVRTPTLEVQEMSGEVPLDLQLAFDGREGATTIARGLPIAGGEVGLLTADLDIRDRPARPAFYDRVRRYRASPPLTARRIRSGPYVVEDFVVDGRLERGMMVADTVQMHVLGGDIAGNMAFQLGRDSSVRGDMTFNVSNMDASYFEALKLEGGEDSQMNADFRASFLFAPTRRDVAMNMNITKVGPTTFDRFLQLLDPEAKNDNLQKNRRLLNMMHVGPVNLATIDHIAMWMRYESFNMDLVVTSLFRVPGTTLQVPNIDRELVRRYSMSEWLARFVYEQPWYLRLGPMLGWDRAS